MKSISLLVLTVSLVVISSPAVCQEDTSERLQELERRVAELEDQSGNLLVPLLFIFGVFCALWAQNTGRKCLVVVFSRCISQLHRVAGAAGEELQ